MFPKYFAICGIQSPDRFGFISMSHREQSITHNRHRTKPSADFSSPLGSQPALRPRRRKACFLRDAVEGRPAPVRPVIAEGTLSNHAEKHDEDALAKSWKDDSTCSLHGDFPCPDVYEEGGRILSNTESLVYRHSTLNWHLGLKLEAITPQPLRGQSRNHSGIGVRETAFNALRFALEQRRSDSLWL